MKTPTRSLLLAATLTAAAAASASSGDDPRLIVHEWGTLTSVAGDDGLPIAWRPLGTPDDLPRFVHGLGARNVPNLGPEPSVKANLTALVRMETPVLYFYVDRPVQVSAQVRFPGGWITEWYPRGDAIGAGIGWDHVDVLPGEPAAFPAEAEPSRYYEARQTDAAPLRVPGPGEERERFLFYRGVGSLAPWLYVRLEGEHVVVQQAGAAVSRVVLFENRAGQVGHTVRALKGSTTTLSRPALGASLSALWCELQDMLVAEGLYPREAEAMIATWRDSWFEEGLRVLYILPRPATDRALPLTVRPRPAEIVRVMIARTEIITPEMERTFQDEIGTAGEGTADAALVARLVRTRGRFAEPILRRLQARSADPALRARIGGLIAATAPTSTPLPSAVR